MSSEVGVLHYTTGYYARIHPRTESNRVPPQGNIAWAPPAGGRA